ncbi:MauE/DoxX family redox-associated membrane protein [Niastella yeongjuensis]|nr:MauE/DoxX family redox-associated membrane protein [Niastella yeongjuensis]
MKNAVIEIVSYLFILLFFYTGVMKLTDHRNFYFVMDKSHLLYRFAAILAWVIPILELAIVACLVVPKWRRVGLYASFILMSVFTIYVAYNAFFLTHAERPCTCGGIIEQMNWQQHVVFNACFTGLALCAVLFNKKRAQAPDTGTANLSLS